MKLLVPGYYFIYDRGHICENWDTCDSCNNCDDSKNCDLCLGCALWSISSWLVKKNNDSCENYDNFDGMKIVNIVTIPDKTPQSRTIRFWLFFLFSFFQQTHNFKLFFIFLAASAGRISILTGTSQRDFTSRLGDSDLLGLWHVW